MKSILLDTNIVSFLFEKDTRAKAYAPYLEGRKQAISFMTVAELFQWAKIRAWGQSASNNWNKPFNHIPFWVVVTLYVIVMARSPRRSHLDGMASQSLAMTPSCTVYHYPMMCRWLFRECRRRIPETTEKDKQGKEDLCSALFFVLTARAMLIIFDGDGVFVFYVERLPCIR